MCFLLTYMYINQFKDLKKNNLFNALAAFRGERTVSIVTSYLDQMISP